MERGHIVVIAVVLAALGLFGLKVWSDHADESNLTSGGRVVGNLARLDTGRRGGSDGGDDWGGTDSGGSARPGRGSGGRVGGRFDGSSGSDRGGGGGFGGRGTDVVRGAGSRGGGTLGYSTGGSGSGGGSGGGGTIGDSGGGGLAPKPQKKSDLVDFLSSQPATHGELATEKNENGEDVALKIDKPEDISKNGGVDQNVQDNGDGIKIGEDGKITFPNNVSPEAATFSFKIQPDWAGADATDNALVELRGENQWSNRIELVKNGEFLRFILTDNTGKETDISTRITDWQAGDPHDIRASYGNCNNGSCQTSLYVDGRLAGTNSYQGQLDFASSTPLFVGGDHRGSNYAGANATISGFTITNSATP
jgi:hypothetical protein